MKLCAVVMMLMCGVAAACDTGCPGSSYGPPVTGGGGGGGGNNNGGGHGNGGGGENGGGGGGPFVRTCPVNIVKVGVCSPLLGGVGPDCCPLLGLLGVDIEICLCLALDVNVLGIVDINIPKLDIVASIMTSCGYTPTPNFVCP